MTSNKLTKEEKKVLTGWGTALLIIVVVLLIINYFFPVKTIFQKLTAGSEFKETYSGIEDDFSRFRTVSATIEKMYSYINMKDYDSVVKILNEKYVKDNKITKENVDEFIKFGDKKMSFVPNIMYHDRVDEGIYEYFVDGYLVYSNTGEQIEKAYFRVVLDNNTFLFNIKPITQKEYEEVQ